MYIRPNIFIVFGFKDARFPTDFEDGRRSDNENRLDPRDSHASSGNFGGKTLELN